MQSLELREPDLAAHDAITRVAQGMRETLIEGEGEARGSALYTPQWLEARVRWPLDPAQSQARVVVAADPQGHIHGDTMFRIESSGRDRVGLISTTYVWPANRRTGLATRLLACAKAWFIEQQRPRCCTGTSSTNAPSSRCMPRTATGSPIRAPTTSPTHC